jgi:hypothetical protein
LRKPAVSPVNRERRVTWCRWVLPWTIDDNWSYWVHSDEVRYNLGFNDGRVRVWRTDWERYIPQGMSEVQKNYVLSVMFWGASVTMVLARWLLWPKIFQLLFTLTCW